MFNEVIFKVVDPQIRKIDLNYLNEFPGVMKITEWKDDTHLHCEIKAISFFIQFIYNELSQYNFYFSNGEPIKKAKVTLNSEDSKYLFSLLEHSTEKEKKYIDKLLTT